MPLAGGLLGLLAFASGLGLVLVNPTRYEWLLTGDWAVHFMGWHLYRASPWTSPLGATANLGWPIGTSVALTDSIPILAALLKPLDPVLPPTFQYIGFWLLLCYVLQGVFGVLVMRVLTPSMPAQILGASLIVMSPPLIGRFGHPALSAHWLLLAAVWLYLRDTPQTSSAFSQLVAWALVAGIAAATHPYLALMVLIVMVAAHARWVMVDSSAWRRAAARLSVLATVAGLALWQSGYFIVSEQGLRVSGFGEYSMNLLAPLMPAGTSLVFGAGPFSYASAGQYEGYAYLGAGLLFLSVFALGRLAVGVWRLRWRSRYWQHLPATLACVLFVVLALSPVVTAGSRTLFEYDGSWLGPLATFRASGRMFWPVFYALTIAILFAATRFRLAMSLMLLTAACVVQAVDLSGTYRGLRNLRTGTFTDTLQSPFWREIAPRYTHLTLIPTNICTPNVDFLPFTLQAGRHGQTINAGLAARYDGREITRYCEALSAEVKAGTVSPGTLYILQPTLVPGFRAGAQAQTVCTRVDGYGVCTRAEDYLAWQDRWDIIMVSLPPATEVVQFHQALEDDYRNRLKRPTHAAYGTAEERSGTIARYLGYRMDGCSHDKAAEKTLRYLRGQPELRICENLEERRQPLPAPNETFAFLRQLESLYANQGHPSPAARSVDLEGEAVWLQEYLRQRLSGRAHAESSDAVLRAIRQVAPSPPSP